jgi:hypothetical protein
MANIVATSMQGPAARPVTRTTMTASDTLTYNAGRNAMLVLDNTTAGALTVVLDGSGGTTVPVAGVGSVDVSAGYSTGSIAAGACVAIPLDSISAYLQGVIAITGGVGIKASLLEF